MDFSILHIAAKIVLDKGRPLKPPNYVLNKGKLRSQGLMIGVSHYARIAQSGFKGRESF